MATTPLDPRIIRTMADNGHPVIHLVTTALMGMTAEHLRDDHGVEPVIGGGLGSKGSGTPASRENVRRHLVAHDVPSEDW